jgi:[glutamine synthetase] adenylyltransferase / [glutamine synthetase]-adenylyl-L-tyrosine phosphorylase
MKRARRFRTKKAGPKPSRRKSTKTAAKASRKKRPAQSSRARASKPTAKAGQDWTLAGRIAAAPVLSDAKAARKRVAAWLNEINTASAKALASLFATYRQLQALTEGIAESSPFLWALITADAGRFVRLLKSDPDAHLASLFSETSAAVARTADETEVMRLLRKMKAEAALLIALCDIGAVWPIMRATAALTELADTAAASAVRFLLTDAAKAGRLLPIDKKQPDKGSGYIVLAMGKMGAGELNYSSDIDLIVLYDPNAGALAKNMEPAPFWVRITQRLVKLLQERTGDGYVFRTDLRLRPDPASTAIAISTEAALSYYESSGQNWERAAMIKARPCAGDIAAGGKLLEAIAPFVWRKYLDFAAVADVRAMKQQIHAYRGHGEIAVEGHNIKLGRGGIREVEFFAQTQQLIAGGRNPALRDRETLPTLDKLAEDGWIDTAARDDMRAAYLFLRKVEHRLQMMHDDQTQTLPDDRVAIERFAHFLGFPGRDAFAKELVSRLETVQRRYAALFEAPAADKAEFSFPADVDDKRTLDRLVEIGFRAPLETSARIRQWLSGEYRSLRSETARTQLTGLLPLLLEHFARTSNPDAALIPFDRFLSNLHNATRLLSLLRQNPELIGLIAIVIGTAPRLADILARYPQVVDTLVEPSFFGVLPNGEELARRLDVAIKEALYDEDLLDRIRMFGLEHMFLIGVRILTGTVTAAQAGEAFARLADVIIREVHRAVADNFAQQHGHLRKEQSAVLALGKLGGNEMTASSDLDLILIYDFDEANPESDGKRPLHGAQYFARLTQRLINALTAQTNYGALYEVDMRLRPSGRSGPLATMLSSFASYQDTDAWTWEHMALTRARVLSASAGFGSRVQKVISGTLAKQRDPELIAGDVVEMRGAIAKEKGDAVRWDIKYAAGGLTDIEFIAQYLQLVHANKHPDIVDTSTARVLEKARALGLLTAEDADVLRPAVRLYQALTQILRLCLPSAFDPKTSDVGLLRLLARAADVPDFPTLEATLAETQVKVRESFVRVLGAAPEPAHIAR